nr:LysR substrate-binding domain-containing protein [Saccharibacter sp. 17.LH.SD]
MAFEAAARHGSFSRAASELSLTEGAISRQIARLESFLETTLFERVGNRVRLLPNGERYAAQVREILDRLERDSQLLMRQPSGSASLDIATLPTFATRWLIPRLRGFEERHPNITIHLAERMDPFVLTGSGFDAAIHFDHPAWAGMRIHHLLNEVLIPVCHPALLERKKTNILDDLPRLHRWQNPDAWHQYAQDTGLTLTNPAIGARYDLHIMLIEAALSELGVALVPRLYVERDLLDGRLIAPWPASNVLSKTFCLILPEPLRLSRTPIQNFAHWLIQEAKSAGGHSVNISQT